MSSLVLIPSIGVSDRLEAVLLAACESAADSIVVIENQERSGNRHSPSAFCVWEANQARSFYMDAPSASLHRVWNVGIHMTQYLSDDRLPVCVILNDDIEVTSAAISYVIEAFETNRSHAVIGFNYFTRNLDPVTPSRLRNVSGTYRHGGIGGFAFACRADVCKVDEQFEIWGGDDDLVFDAMDRGYQIGILEGAPVLHPEPETTVRLFPELLEAKDRDRERLRVKWKDTW